MTYATAKEHALNSISPRVGEMRESKNLGIITEVLSINGLFVTVNAHGLGVWTERTAWWLAGTIDWAHAHRMGGSVR